jgi:hypothetical protein
LKVCSWPFSLTRGALYYDVTAAIQPWYGDHHNDQRAGLYTFLGSLQNPYLLAVFENLAKPLLDCEYASLKLNIPHISPIY